MKKNDSTIFNFLTISFMQIVFNLNIFNKIDFSTLIFIISSSIISPFIFIIMFVIKFFASGKYKLYHIHPTSFKLLLLTTTNNKFV